MFFKDIPGHDELKKRLIQSKSGGKLAHALLFSGHTGAAQLPLALAFASYILCESPTPDDSCGTCPACLKSHKLIHPDLHFSFPVARTPAIKSGDPVYSSLFLSEWRTFLNQHPYGSLETWQQLVAPKAKLLLINREESRQIVKTLSLKSFESAYKIMLMWLPEKANKEAANAILKIIEEPPAGTVFLFVTENREQVLPTILSRCQSIPVRYFQEMEIASYLEKTSALDEKQLKTIARLADGKMPDPAAIEAPADESGHHWFKVWMRRCYERDMTSLHQLAEQFHKYAMSDQLAMLTYGLFVFRESILMKSGATELVRSGKEEQSFIERFGGLLDLDQVTALTGKFNQAIYQIERNIYARLLFLHLSFEVSGIIRPMQQV